MIQIRINDLRSLGSWKIKWTNESLSRVDSSVYFIFHDPSDLGSLILIRIIPKEHALSVYIHFNSNKNKEWIKAMLVLIIIKLYRGTILIRKTTEWLIHKVNSPCIICSFFFHQFLYLFLDNFKNQWLDRIPNKLQLSSKFNSINKLSILSHQHWCVTGLISPILKIIYGKLIKVRYIYNQ